MSLKLAKTFEYYNQDTIIHRLDPRIKMLIVLCFTIPAFIVKTPVLISILFLCLLPFLIMGKILPKFKMGIEGLLPFIVIIVILNTYIIDFNSAFVVIVRLLILMGSFSILMQTTSPEAFSQALVKLHVKYEYAATITIAFRFIPTLANDLEQIKDAQYSRGHSFNQKGFFGTVYGIFPLFVPLIIMSIRRSFSLAEALESRAFGAIKDRTDLFELKIKFRDILLLFVSLGITFGILYLNYVISLQLPILLYTFPV